MTTLIICRGLQASGKTTKAKAWVAEDPIRRARVNRDDLRQMAHDGVWKGRDTENQITAIRDAAIASLLKRGIDVVCDDTNLPQRVARDVARVGRLNGAEIEVWDLTDVPLETCVERDAAREKTIGGDVIRKAHGKFVAGHPYPLPLPVDPESSGGVARPYLVPLHATPAIIVDIDGTVALHGMRDPFDETRVHEDRPNLPVIAAVQSMADAGHAVIFCSGRTEGCRDATERWINEHVKVDWVALHMRPIGDMRKDAVVKLEIFDAQIRDDYNVVAVFDDRDQVVGTWRSIGLTVFQVAPGNF